MFIDEHDYAAQKGYCFTLNLEQEPKAVVESSTTSAMRMQYARTALAKWRVRNPWANAIEYKDFPEKYKDLIKTAACMLQYRGEE